MIAFNLLIFSALFANLDAAKMKNPKLTESLLQESDKSTGTVDNNGCADTDVRFHEGVAEILYQGNWYPMCGHYAWDTNSTATNFCQKLGYTTGVVTRTDAIYDRDAMPTGICYPGESFDSCTGGGNDWGDFTVGDSYSGSGYCQAGKPVGMDFTCSGGQSPVSTTCPESDDGSIEGDPHFVGFDGSHYDFQGVPGEVFNIITDNNFQMNAKFVLAPSDGQTYMGELGIISSGNRVLFTPLSTKLNGKKVQDGVFRPFGPGWIRIEGLTTVVSTPSFTITITVENVESFLYLNVGAKVESSSLHDPHGLLGQTAYFLIVHEKPKPVILSHQNKNGKGFIAGSPIDYLVSDGIFGTQFRFNRFSDTPSKEGKSRSKKLKHALEKAGRRTFVVAHTEAIFQPRSIHGRN